MNKNTKHILKKLKTKVCEQTRLLGLHEFLKLGGILITDLTFKKFPNKCLKEVLYSFNTIYFK